jgi:predicted ATP-grasp superfamily ATP-dependent carboligase
VRVPACSIVTSAEDAAAFGERHGYPLVVKRRYPIAGEGVQVVSGREGLESAIAALRTEVTEDFEPDPTRRVVVQKYIDGPVHYQMGAAWRGRYLAGYAAERLEAQGGLTGEGTVVKCRDVPALRDFSAQLAEAFGITGLFTCEYAIEQASGLPHLLGISRRPGLASHFGGILDVDLFAALFAAMQRRPSPTRSRPGPDESRVFVHFPAEWLRDPQSTWLRRHPVDVPWDDPELLDAMLALRSER